MSGYVLTPAAQTDIEIIWNYTVQNWGTIQAERYLRNIQAVCEGLGNGTQPSRSAEHIRKGYRKIQVGSHMIYFRAEAVILIVRILHCSMDVERHL